MPLAAADVALVSGEICHTQDLTHLLYSLSYFDDAEGERMPRMFWDVKWRTA